MVADVLIAEVGFEMPFEDKSCVCEEIRSFA